MKNKTIVLCFIAVLFGLSMVIAQKPCNNFECKLQLARNALNANPPQYQKALDLARGAESYDPKRKAEVYTFIQAVFDAIDKKRVEAEQASIKAIKAEKDANTAKADTKKALDKLQATANDAVTILLAEIDRNIMRLEYDSTFKKCQTAVKLDAQPEEVKKRLLEIAYFYTETDTLNAAIKTLKLLNINSLPNREDLLKTIQQNSPPQYFTFLDERYYPKMIKVEGGTFTMGSNDYDNEKPPHSVKVNSFWIAETETTVWQYFLYLKAKREKPYDTPSWQYSGDNPMIYVSWDDVQEYLKWVNEQRKNGVYKLPTEAEWEFAARGGNQEQDKTLKYSGSKDVDKVAWYTSNSSSRTQPVKRLQKNALGLYDMSGNVYEWCRDNYDQNFYADCAKQGTVENPLFEKTGNTIRVIRGGSWSSSSSDCRVSYRSGDDAYIHSDYLGFRCVRYD